MFIDVIRNSNMPLYFMWPGTLQDIAYTQVTNEIQIHADLSEEGSLIIGIGSYGIKKIRQWNKVT